VYNYHKFLAIEKRLDQVERSVDKITAKEPPKAAVNLASFNQNEVVSVRERRSALQKSTNLQSLAKRVSVIESRIRQRNKSFAEELLLKTFLRGRDGRDGRPGPPGPAGQPGLPGKFIVLGL